MISGTFVDCLKCFINKGQVELMDSALCCGSGYCQGTSSNVVQHGVKVHGAAFVLFEVTEQRRSVPGAAVIFLQVFCA